MNAAEQRAHRTVTQSLEQRIETLEALLLQVSKNCDWLKAQYESLRTYADVVSGEVERAKQRVEVAHKLSSAGMEAIVKHEYMTISARLRWLLLGR